MVDYVDLDYSPTDKDLIAMYYVEKAPQCEDIEHACMEIAKESSIGTWTEILTMSEDIAKRLKPSAFHIDDKNNIIKIAYTEDLFEANNISQILSAIAGNIFGMKKLKYLRLMDICFPKNIVKAYKGPKFGIEGIRALTNINKRPLLGTIVKPKVGLNEQEHAEVCRDAWRGGLDIVKDDENLTSMKFNSFEDRISKTLDMRDQIEDETGEKKIYMPNITSTVSTMKERANFVKEQGGEYVMIDIVTTGFAAVMEMREYLDSMDLVIHAHRAMHAAFTRIKTHGMTMLALAKIMRLIGVDQLHTGTVVGKMEGEKQEVLDINKEITQKKVSGNNITLLDQDWYDLKPVLPVASGGLNPLDVPELIEILGTNIVYQFGGGTHGHPDGTKAGAMAIRQAVDATLKNINLNKYAQTHQELNRAIEKWG
ncbi:MAG: type III ribulose-bisphosphate carboxylase [Promethearchaeota archaeon]|nr:MAG: type III ribulose-bisphosphate carboxylase [Candidatus Lokiarchaeota archaeon]